MCVLVCVCVLTDISFNHGMCCIETFYKYIDFHLFLVQKSFRALNLPLVLEIESPSNLKMLWQYYSHPPPNGFYEWSNIYTLPYYLVSLQYSFNILLIFYNTPANFNCLSFLFDKLFYSYLVFPTYYEWVKNYRNLPF